VLNIQHVLKSYIYMSTCSCYKLREIDHHPIYLFSIKPTFCGTVTYRSIPKGWPGNASREFLRYPSRSKNTVFLLSAAQSIANLFDLEAGPANLIWPCFGNTTVSLSSIVFGIVTSTEVNVDLGIAYVRVPGYRLS
jgi:hypothetical protein